MTATTPVQLTTLVSVNSIINFPEKTDFLYNINKVIQRCRYEIMHFKAGRFEQFIQNLLTITSAESFFKSCEGRVFKIYTIFTILNQVFTPNNLKPTPTKNTAINEEIRL